MMITTPTRTPVPTGELLTVKDAARLLGYSEMHVYRLIAEGELQKRQRGKHCRIALDRRHVEAKKREWGR